MHYPRREKIIVLLHFPAAQPLPGQALPSLVFIVTEQCSIHCHRGLRGLPQVYRLSPLSFTLLRTLWINTGHQQAEDLNPVFPPIA
jgi:hypothetical protein